MDSRNDRVAPSGKKTRCRLIGAKGVGGSKGRETHRREGGLACHERWMREHELSYFVRDTLFPRYTGWNTSLHFSPPPRPPVPSPPLPPRRLHKCILLYSFPDALDGRVRRPSSRCYCVRRGDRTHVSWANVIIFRNLLSRCPHCVPGSAEQEFVLATLSRHPSFLFLWPALPRIEPSSRCAETSDRTFFFLSLPFHLPLSVYASRRARVPVYLRTHAREQRETHKTRESTRAGGCIF